MTCFNCDQEVVNQFDHLADCEQAPESIRLAAKAERRANSGGPFSEPHIWDCGSQGRINRLDRGLPDPLCRGIKDGCL